MSSAVFSTALGCFGALIVMAVMPAVAASQYRMPPTEYYEKLPLEGPPHQYTADYEMCVKIFHSRRRGYVSVWNFMPDSAQYLVISVAALLQKRSGRLMFKFQDGLGNNGIGSIEYPDAEHVRVDLEATKKTDDPVDRNILRQYGVNVLPKAPCPTERNRLAGATRSGRLGADLDDKALSICLDARTGDDIQSR